MAMIGGLTGVTKDAYRLDFARSRNYLEGLNLIGLRRQNMIIVKLWSLTKLIKKYFIKQPSSKSK